MIHQKRGVIFVIGLLTIIGILTFVSAPIQECNYDIDCPEGDYCYGNICLPLLDECSIDSDCPQGDVCETGKCNYNPSGYRECSLVPISNCCTSYLQCNDGNLCTNDNCINNICENSPKDCTYGCDISTGQCYPGCPSDNECSSSQYCEGEVPSYCVTGSCGYLSGDWILFCNVIDNKADCNAEYPDKCIWIEGTTQIGSIIDCYSDSHCDGGVDWYCKDGTIFGDCLPKKANCEICTANEQCLSNKCVTDFYSSEKICIPEDKICANSQLTANGCGAYVHENNFCEGGTAYSCEPYADGSGTGFWDDLTCQCGCTDGFCDECLDNCDTGCVNDDDCGINSRCAKYPDGTTVCIPDDMACGLWGETDCAVKDLSKICYGKDNPQVLQCSGKSSEQWGVIQVCSYGCENGACINPKIIWENAQGTPITTIDLGQTTPLGSVNIVFENYDYSGLTDTTFIIKEKDDFSEGSIDDNVLSINGESDGNGNLIATWEITSANVDSSINTWDNEPDGQLEFYVTLNSYQADLTANIQSGYCGDGTCDINSENCTICEEDCGICLPLGCTDEVQNGEETGIDCGGTECPSCEKAPYWTTENMPYELIDETETSIMTVEDIVDGTHTFRMVLQNPVDTGATFELREDDFLGSDLIQDNIPGTLDSNGHLETFWTPTMADFLNAGGGNDYEFYFNVDTETSTNLVINVDTSGDDFPTCNDGIMNGDEEGEDCGGSCEEIDETKVCPPPVCFNVQTCGSYLDQTTCEIDECNVSEKSSPDLGENETASCIWIDASDKCDVEESSYYGDVKIGSCVYDEDTSTDNCDDGFLSYSWDAYFDWGENSYTTEALCEAAVDDECKEIEGFWHYDPADYRSSCQAGSQTIPCPAQIQLNFFTWKNFFAAALLILIVYIILKNSNTVKKASKKKINSKKKVKKKKISKKKK